MHLSLGSSSSSKEAYQQDARESRRLFRESVRTDWHYPPLPNGDQQEAQEILGAEMIGGFKIHRGIPREHLEQVIPEVVDWRERYYGTSDSETEEDTVGPHSHIAAQAKTAEYVFEGPDSVGDEINDRAAQRKRKRQHALAEEMQWNNGLQHFISRRDAWTNARTRSQVQLLRSKTAVSSAAEAYNGSVTSSPRSSTSGNTDITMQSRPSTATTSPDPVAMSKAPTLHIEDMLVPLMSRVLTAHPVRKKIGPSMYSEIYAKIVLQSRTPAVPINLLNLTKALVQGWKADGEWPPKLNAPEPSIGRKKASSIKQAVTRVLKITDSKDKKPG